MDITAFHIYEYIIALQIFRQSDPLHDELVRTIEGVQLLVSLLAPVASWSSSSKEGCAVGRIYGIGPTIV